MALPDGLEVRALAGGFDAAEVVGLVPERDAASEPVHAAVQDRQIIDSGLVMTEEPASATVLHARALPPSGGDNTRVWDNASVQHKAGGDFPVGEPRRFWRHMVEGSRPV